MISRAIVTALCWVNALVAYPVWGAALEISQMISATCRFASPALVTDTNGLTHATVAGCVPYQRAGLPVLPFQTLRLMLPPGHTATGVVAHTTSPAVMLSGTWQIELGRNPTASVPTAPRATASSVPPAPSPDPPAMAELVSVQRLAGYDVAVIRVFPLQYFSDLRRLTFAAEVTVTVVLSPTTDRLIPPSPRFAEQQRVKAMIANPEAFSTTNLPHPNAVSDPAAHYLLVTRAALLPAFQPLIAQKTAAGLIVHTETMENVANNYAGADAAECLRNFIRHAYTTWDVGYVLLGGDIQTVPYRGAYARCSGVTRTAMPADLYFACLDGSWNHDGDALWGEPTDGETGGDVDLLAEVCVGRAPVETASEVTNFVARCLAAAQIPASQFRACLAGEFLNDAGAQGGDALDHLLPAFDTSHCPIAWLDDRQLASASWTTSDALDTLNRSPLLAAHFGHGVDYGYDTTAMRLTVPDLVALTNATPFLLYSTACNTGAFDNNFGMGNCIAEELVTRNACGAFAVLANSREGWYDSASESRYSGEFQQRFFERLLSDAETPIGVAHQLAKQDLLGSVETSGSNMPYRWCIFGITLFGDPHTAVHVPLSLRFRTHPSECVVTWNSWTNRTYRVFRATTLHADEFVCIASNLLATPPSNVYTNSVQGRSRAFYRVTTE